MKQIKKQNLTTQNDQGTPYLFTLPSPKAAHWFINLVTLARQDGGA